MKTVKVELTAQQISMLLGCLYEAKNIGSIDPSEFDLFRETESIIEQAEDDLFIQSL
jgi:hypothetical protein